jgi:hypothetical protein
VKPPSASNVIALRAIDDTPSASRSRVDGVMLRRRIITYLRLHRKWLAVAVALGLAAGAVAGPVVATLVDLGEDWRVVP